MVGTPPPIISTSAGPHVLPVYILQRRRRQSRNLTLLFLLLLLLPLLLKALFVVFFFRIPNFPPRRNISALRFGLTYGRRRRRKRRPNFSALGAKPCQAISKRLCLLCSNNRGGPSKFGPADKEGNFAALLGRPPIFFKVSEWPPPPLLLLFFLSPLLLSPLADWKSLPSSPPRRKRP